MARGSGTVVVSIIGKADKLKATLDESGDDLKGFGNKLDGFGKSAMATGAKVTAGLTLPIIGGLGLATKAAAEDADAQAHLAQALKNSTGATAEQVKQAEAWVTSAQKISTFSDDDLRPSLETLVRSTNDLGKAQQLQSVAMDLAAGKGISLEAATKAVAKASEGQFAAVNKLVPGLLDLTDKHLTADMAVQALTKTFSGDAQAATETAAGKTKMLSRDMGEMTEEIGTALLPILDKLIPIVQSVAEWFSGLSDRTQTIILIVAAAAAAIGPLITIVGALSTALAFLAANPVILIIAGIAALAAGLIYAYKTSETFRDIVNGVAQAVTNAFMDMAGWVLDVVDKMLGGFATMAEGASHLPFVGSKFRGVADEIRGVQHSVQDMADSMHKGINIVSDDLERARNGFRDMGLAAANIGFGGGGGGIIVGAGPIKARASGGPVTGGRPYLVGEQGPELFMPSRSGAIVPNGAGGSTTIIVNGSLIGSDETSLARYLNDVQARATARGAI